MQHALILKNINLTNSYKFINILKLNIQNIEILKFFFIIMCASGYRIMAIIRGFQPFDESSILSTRSKLISY
jgi:hypothetical protein